MKRVNTPASKDSFGEKLKSYSMLAGSVIASSLTAQAQVIYTDVNPDIEIGGVPPPYPDYVASDSIDLNNDGIFDFKLQIHFYGTFTGDYSFTERIAAINNLNNSALPYTNNYAPVPWKLDCDDSIPFPYYAFGFNFAFFAIQSQNNVMYFWNNLHDKSVGLKFFAGGDLYWGWVRLDVNTADTVPNIIIKDFAYNETPNEHIAACDTGFAVGTHESLIKVKNQFLVFPNPSDGSIIIKLNQPISGDLELSVQDALGKEVYASNLKMKWNQRELPLDLSQLSPGIYFIQLKSEGNSFTEKWIKK